MEEQPIPEWIETLPPEKREEARQLVLRGYPPAKVKALFFKGPGRPRKPAKPKRKPGRPRKLESDDYEVMEELRRLGEGFIVRKLLEAGETISPDVKIPTAAALKVGVMRYGAVALGTRLKPTEHEIDKWARDWGKRLSEWKKRRP